jgi:hypothetical protein
MSDAIIKVIDHLAEKIGVAVDWTADNIIPQVFDIMARYRTCEIIISVLIVLLCVGWGVGVYIALKRWVLPARKRCVESQEDNFWFWNCGGGIEPNVAGIIIIAFAIGISLAAIILCIKNIGELTRWALIPEVQFYKLISG